MFGFTNFDPVTTTHAPKTKNILLPVDDWVIFIPSFFPAISTMPYPAEVLSI
jgi:hypothetical protein